MNILFAKSSASTFLPKTEKTNRSENLLPKDLHISCQHFTTLFTNPIYQLQFRSKKTTNNNNNNTSLTNTDYNHSNVEEPMQQEFFADHELISPAELPEMGITTTPEDGFAFDDPFDDDGEDNTQPNGPVDSNVSFSDFLDYGDQLVEQPKKVMTTALKYAKTAKRVDVKKLKENIWKEMNQEEGEEENTKKEEKKFSELIKGLDQFYPEQKRRDISVAFCFICVLHLANEQNLMIQGKEDLKELIISQ